MSKSKWRLGVYVVCLLGLGAWWTARQVSADWDERTLRVGRELAKWSDLSEGTTTLRLNGVQLGLNSSSSQLTVSEVLERFGRGCGDDSGGIKQQLQGWVAEGVALPDYIEPERFGVLRSQTNEREGTSACFARSGDAGLADFIARLGRVADTGDLGAMGQLRYVFARRREGASTTHVISVWTSDVILLEQMFPAEGDAVGEDLPVGVRPAGSRRLLSAKLDGSDQQVAQYESPQPSAAILSDYAQQLGARGYEVADLSRLQGSPVPTGVYSKPDETLLVFVEARPSRSVVSVFRLAHGGYLTLPQ